MKVESLIVVENPGGHKGPCSSRQSSMQVDGLVVIDGLAWGALCRVPIE